MRPAPTPAELRDLVSGLSNAATGSAWHPQTSNAAWFLVRYGGTWGRAAAAAHGPDLDRIDEMSVTLRQWPVLGDGRITANGLLEQDVEMTDRTAFRDARLGLERLGVVKHADALHLLDAPDSAACGSPLPGPRPHHRIARARRDEAPWCSDCARRLSEDVHAETGWEAGDD